MPELPEVETVRRGLAPVLEGRRIVSAEARRPDLRWPLPERFTERLAGRQVAGLGRRAKYLTADLEPTADAVAEVLVMHLGMSGSFRIEEADSSQAPGSFHLARNRDESHDHVVFQIQGGTRIIYNDPRRFGAMLLIPRADLPQHPLFRGLGPEPLGNAFDADHLARALSARRTSMKAALLDQKVVAGLGNIYVCEALHRSLISPFRLAMTLAGTGGRATKQAKLLATSIRAVLEEAIVAGGSSLRDHSQVNGSLGYFQHRFRVYDREGAPCPTPGCTGIVSRAVQNGRSTFYCSACQH